MNVYQIITFMMVDMDYKSSETFSVLQEVVATIADPVGFYGGLATLLSALRLVVSQTVQVNQQQLKR